MLTSADIAGMRTVIQTTLQGTAYIMRATEVSDDMGGVTQTFGTAGTVSCHLSPRAVVEAGEDDTASRIVTEGLKTLTCPSTADLRTTDRVRVSGTDYEVLSVSTPRTWALSLRASVKLVD